MSGWRVERRKVGGGVGKRHWEGRGNGREEKREKRVEVTRVSREKREDTREERGHKRKSRGHEGLTSMSMPWRMCEMKCERTRREIDRKGRVRVSRERGSKLLELHHVSTHFGNVVE